LWCKVNLPVSDIPVKLIGGTKKVTNESVTDCHIWLSYAFTPHLVEASDS